MLKTLSKYTFFTCILICLSVNPYAAELTIETYTGKLMPSNSVILSSDKETLVIDAQFLRPDAQDLIAQIETTGKPLTSILLTHEHPDHVFGAAEILKKYPSARVYARPDVIDEILFTFRARVLRWTEDFGDMIPTAMFEIHPLEGDTFDFDDHAIKIIELLPAETINATGYYIPELKTYVPGDQIFYRFHAYIAGGLNYPEAWIKSIEEVRNNYDIDVVVPGHGPVGKADEVFNSAIGYLQAYADIYKPLLKQSTIAKHMVESFPDYPFREVLYMTRGPAVTAPDLIEMLGGQIGFRKEH